jgi:hypothetical protein
VQVLDSAFVYREDGWCQGYSWTIGWARRVGQEGLKGASKGLRPVSSEAAHLPTVLDVGGPLTFVLCAVRSTCSGGCREPYPGVPSRTFGRGARRIEGRPRCTRSCTSPSSRPCDRSGALSAEVGAKHGQISWWPGGMKALPEGCKHAIRALSSGDVIPGTNATGHEGRGWRASR